MICQKCKSEIESGSIFCPKCGEAIQIVPDYNILDDDFLYSMVDKKEESKNADVESVSSKTNVSEVKDKNCNKTLIQHLKDPNNRRYVIASGVATLFIICISIVLYVNSYSYCFKKAVKCDKSGDYKNACEYYLKAIGRDDTQYEAYEALGIDYYNLEKYEDAITYLNYAIDINPEALDSYDYIIKAYLAIGDYESINNLKSTVTDSDILAIFDDNVVSAPEFSISAGSYNDDFDLELSSSKGDTIYYTTDGSNPISSNTKMEYTEAIRIEEGETCIKAVCLDLNGKYSQVVTAKYNVKYSKPDKPAVSIENGSFTTETFITVTVPENCNVYYTWDGSVPNESSSKYVEPIRVIEGNNILSLVSIDDHGMISDVLECNYKYLP
ncbi:MAG: chitobiase/beta-hexosaminidase C-terminal domain-containing protein [Lachnospiraceae bacterium]|nr:chitobiase/beta-hexosaminidase C-terminal domain-containing protein [Lachnospiraceae bacterium]